jgi:hypothetical protein
VPRPAPARYTVGRRSVAGVAPGGTVDADTLTAAGVNIQSAIAAGHLTPAPAPEPAPKPSARAKEGEG